MAGHKFSKHTSLVSAGEIDGICNSLRPQVQPLDDESIQQEPLIAELHNEIEHPMCFGLDVLGAIHCLIWAD